MQSNIFAKVAPLLKEKKLNIDCNAVLEFLEQPYKSGSMGLSRCVKYEFKD